MPPSKPAVRNALTLVVLGLMAGALWLTKPVELSVTATRGDDATTGGCLDNLGQISRAYALYAQDFDGKFPRGTDPEDRYNAEIWRNSEFGELYYEEAKKTPMLHEILRPYVSSPEVFRCPGDNGWKRSSLPTLSDSALQNVFPSSFKEYGTSYYVFTRYGFTLMTAADLENPGQTLLLFDGDLWHRRVNRKTLNGLFADGSARNLTSAQFEIYSRG